MRKYLSLFLLVLLFSGMTGQVFADNYWYDVSEIFKVIQKDLSDFSRYVSAFGNGNMTKAELRNSILDYKYRAFNQLEKMVILYPKASDKKMHIELLSIISDWYLSNELVEEGLANNDVKKTDAVIQIMKLFSRKLNE